jgi:hypothetical protein
VGALIAKDANSVVEGDVVFPQNRRSFMCIVVNGVSWKNRERAEDVQKILQVCGVEISIEDKATSNIVWLTTTRDSSAWQLSNWQSPHVSLLATNALVSWQSKDAHNSPTASMYASKNDAGGSVYKVRARMLDSASITNTLEIESVSWKIEGR